jgi:uncharacterized membrane protein YqjE
MESDNSQPRFSWRGTSSLVVAVAVVLILIIGWPAYRLFFVISLGIGVVVAAILYFWHRLRPLKEEDIENKRPLGLDQ